MNSEKFKKRQEELRKLGADNEAAGAIPPTPSFLDYRDGYRLISGITMYMSIATFAFVILAFTFYVKIEPQKTYATTTHGEVYEITPQKITN
jgi:hypothetical protein